tara:strand:- start:440 stop:610 length:171 start_codon:yes stop_codon:yes gene_type:complete
MLLGYMLCQVYATPYRMTFKMGKDHDWYKGCTKEEIEMYKQMREDQQSAKKIKEKK